MIQTNTSMMGERISNVEHNILPKDSESVLINVVDLRRILLKAKAHDAVLMVTRCKHIIAAEQALADASDYQNALCSENCQSKLTTNPAQVYTVTDVMNAWNAQADEYNQWDKLSCVEMVEFTLSLTQLEKEWRTDFENVPDQDVLIRHRYQGNIEYSRASLEEGCSWFCYIIDDFIEIEDFIDWRLLDHDEKQIPQPPKGDL